jgi:hypothetical protein
MTAKEMTKSQNRLGIKCLKEIWQHYQDIRLFGTPKQPVEWKYISGLCNALGLGLEPTIQQLMQSSGSFDVFETWVIRNGHISTEQIEAFNALVINEYKPTEAIEPVLNAADLEHWKNEGYVVLKNAVSKEDCARTVRWIYAQIEASPNQPDSWYKPHALKQGIMLQLFKHPLLNKNRLSSKIKQACMQLWQRQDLMVSMDRVSFNPPETDTYAFPGPNLHWDVSLKRPIPFGLQGLLYLTDTESNQGAFTLVPGFHKKIDDWLDTLPSNAKALKRDFLDSVDSKPIAASAGDFIIWHQALPHGSAPNMSQRPRIVQYINYQPLDMSYQNEWV